MKNTMLGRREVLLHTLFGAGAIGLRALATGLPAALLASPRTAFADEKAAACFSSDKAQFVIWSTSAAGDPLNANVPGTYDDPNIGHSLDPAMAKTPITLGGQAYNAARAWSALPQSTLDRTCFFHHSTQTNSHSNQAKVMELMGATKDQEMLVSVLARQLAPCLGTIQREPLTLGAVGPAEALRYGGRALPLLSPSALGATLANPTGPLANLQKMRDADLSRLNDLFRREGTAVQRDFLDRYATSQSQVRLLSQDLLSTLDGIKDDTPASQVAAAIALIRMKVAPVISIHIPFGGDNHVDPNLQAETTQTVSGVQTIARLMQQLSAAGLEDRVTFVSLNVFGRTLSLKQGRAGRGHHADHHCTVMIGKPIRAGVIGGVAPLGTDFGALPIDSRTGRGDPNGDIAFTDTLASVGKTIGAAVGVDPNVLSTAVTSGKVVATALA